jgi:hypothetical protein
MRLLSRDRFSPVTALVYIPITLQRTGQFCTHFRNPHIRGRISAASAPVRIDFSATLLPLGRAYPFRARKMPV